MDRIKGDAGGWSDSRFISLIGENGKKNGKQRKSIRTTTAAIISVTLLGLIILLSVFSFVSLDSGFSSLEERLTGDNVRRALNAVNAEVDRLDSIANAWATSEELPEFIESGDTSVARAVFTDGRLVDVGVNILLITDSEGNILWHKYMNLDYGHQMPTPKSLLSQITDHENVIGSEAVKGTLMLNSGPMLLASCPIFDQESGDLTGDLLVGRYLDRSEVSSLSATTQLNISIIEDREGSEEYFEIFRDVETDEGEGNISIVVNAMDNEYVAGFSEIYDIYGEPVAVLQVTEPRDVTIYGKGVLDLLVMMLVIASIIFGVVTLVLIQRSVISRLEKLNSEIETVAETESAESRINIGGDDEISSVGLAINRMLESIEKGKKQYSRLFDNANDLIFTLDTDGTFISANSASEKKTGVGSGELAGRNIKEFVKNGEMEKIRHLLTEKGEANGGKTEIRLVSTDGDEYLIEFSAQPVMDSGKITGFFFIARDVTAKRNAEEELKKHRNRLKELVNERTAQLEHANSELVKEVEERIGFEESLAAEKERLSVTLSSIAEGVIATDHLGYVTLINREAAVKTGFDTGSVGGKRIDNILRLEKGGRAKDISSIVRNVISEKEIFEINTEVDLFDSEGNTYPVVLSVSPLTDRTGVPIGAVIVFREISERLKWEEEALRRQKLESLGVLAGGIAHDFNNILMAISGNIGLARNMAETGSDVNSRLEEAEKAISRARDITRQLITFSKGGEPVRRVLDIREMIRESAEFVAHGSNINLHFDIAEDLSNVEVDRGQISQVIENLVINSIQAMPDGGNIYIQAKNAGTISGKDGIEDGKYIVLSVRDDGSGIPEEYRKKIFDPYFTTKKSGNGLGLASCMSIIRKHGGAIKLLSEVGVGTEFRIYLPATDRNVEDTEELSGGILSGSSRVLVMDDDKSIYETIPKLLKGYGFDVEAARDGAEAIRIYQQSQILKKPVDVFVMDLTVPGGLGGVETIALLREFDPDILAIVSSGYSNDPVMASFREYGFDAVLPKPYNIEDLVRLINRLVSERKKNGDKLK